jgi:hypothetical protein
VFQRERLQAIEVQARQYARETKDENIKRALRDLVVATDVLDAMLAREALHICEERDAAFQKEMGQSSLGAPSPVAEFVATQFVGAEPV